MNGAALLLISLCVCLLMIWDERRRTRIAERQRTRRIFR